MDWFVLKKIVSNYLQPLSIAVESLASGLILLGLSTWGAKSGKRSRLRRWLRHTGLAFLIMATMFLYLCSTASVAEALAYSLERQYPPMKEDSEDFRALDPEFIVVLAGGWRVGENAPVTSRVLPPTETRVIEGVRLAALFPKARLAFTGIPREVESMADLAKLMGVAPDRILLESRSRDTDDHPKFLKPILGESSFLLVTSGMQLPRAVSLFRGAGLDPVPMPTDLWSYPDFLARSPYQWDRLVPKASYLEMTDVALHEILGRLYSNLRGDAADEVRRPAVVEL
ncbi:MAG: ElyC/SanA/YdcF family protein [Verrucomicrobiales bacterium]|nr:YdcF family protein [Verrucomicrobiae bacterium]MCP5553977.1 YdcF family protein [Akkermansiaceae bacterium]